MLNIFVKDFENLETLSEFLAENYQFSIPQQQLLVDIVFYEMHHTSLPIRARVFQAHEMDDDLGVAFSEFGFMILLTSQVLSQEEIIEFGKNLGEALRKLNNDVILV